LHFPLDDGIVVGEAQMDRITVREYFRKPESLRPMELVFGVVREPPAPAYGHQSIVTRLTALLDRHVRGLDLGDVCVSPVDVVLDAAAALVVQPDIVFVSRLRRRIVRDRIWGAPDLVVEVLSARTATRDRTTKLRWYRRYGVREYWLVDPAGCALDVRPLERGAGGRRVYRGAAPIRSLVLSDWSHSADTIFARSAR
jgi:Uma2 family endonuclease